MTDRPQIHLRPEVHENVDEVIAALRADPNLYQHHGRLVTVCTEPTDPGRVDRLCWGDLELRMGRCATYWSRGRRVSPPKGLARKVLAQGEWPGIPPLPYRWRRLPPLAPAVLALFAPDRALDRAMVAWRVAGYLPKTRKTNAYKTVAEDVLDALVREDLLTRDGAGWYRLIPGVQPDVLKAGP